MSVSGGKFFKYPEFYAVKAGFLRKINGLSGFSLDHLVEGKDILDVGCGSSVHFYDPTKAGKRTGVDLRPEMVDSANRRYPNSFHYVASAKDLHFADNSFDIVLILFVLHHIKPEDWTMVLSEAKRVARQSIVILDHVKHHHSALGWLQQTWWNITDGGYIYRKEQEWNDFFSQEHLNVVSYRRMGMLFGNVCYCHIEL